MKTRLKKTMAILVTAIMVLSMAIQSFAAPLSYAKPAVAASEPAKITGTWSKNASGNWNFNSQDGAIKDGWYYLNTTNKAAEYNWFCFDANGAMKTGWVQDKNDTSIWYYTSESKDSGEGGLVKGWATDPRDGKRYYMDPSTGIMRYGWQLIDNIWYYFGEQQYSNASHPYGAMYVNERTPDGYYVGSNGAWVQNYSGNNNSDNPDPAPKTYYTVTFDMQGHGSQIDPLRNVISGSKIPAPAVPTADGYIFAGWYKEAACANAWNFDTDKVTSNTTIYAKWTTTLTPVDAPTAATGLIYNGTEQTGVAEAAGYTVINGKATGANSYTATATLADGYKWSDGTTAAKQIEWSIAKAALTAAADDKSVTVGDEAPDYTVTYTGWVNGESIGTVTPATEAELACEYTTTSVAGEYDITFTTEPEFANYSVTTVPGKLTVTPALTWGVTGDFCDWYNDVPMTENETNVFISPAIAFTTSNQFKVRYGATWGEDYGAPEPESEPYIITSGVAVEAVSGGWNMAVPEDGNYIVTLNLNNYTITVTSTAPAAPTFKAVYDTADGTNTLTFYYDSVDHSGEHITVYDNLPKEATNAGDWGYNGIRGSVKNVVIDSSVANYDELTSTKCMFCNMNAAESISGAGYLDVSGVTSMSQMFRYFGYDCTTLNTVPDVSDWDTKAVTNITGIFNYYGRNSTALKVVPDVGSWKTSNVTDMTAAFSDYGRSSTVLNDVPDVSDWKTHNVTDMSNVFFNYGRSSTVLNAVPDVSEWDTAAVTSMQNMFQSYGYKSTALDFALDLSRWSVANVTAYSGMFMSAGKDAKTWSVTIPANTGDQANDTTHWYVGDGTETSKYISPTNQKEFTLAAPEIQTIADVLATVEGGFPISDAQNEAPEDAWVVNGETKYAYVYSTALFLRSTGGEKDSQIPMLLTATVKKGESCYTATHNLGTIIFNMEDDELTSITFNQTKQTNTDYSGTYTAPAPKKLAASRRKSIEDFIPELASPSNAIPEEIEIEETEEDIALDNDMDIPDREPEKETKDERIESEVPEIAAELKKEEIIEDKEEVIPEEKSLTMVSEEEIDQFVPAENNQEKTEQEAD